VGERVVVVGGGVLGTLHAWTALARGAEVDHLEREADARGASVRNFGLVWVSGRAPEAELEVALRARDLWDEVAAACPGTGLRPAGSLTVARDEGELAALSWAAAQPDAARRGFTLLDPSGAREANPALRGQLLGALHCRADAVVEPRAVPGAVRAGCERTGRYRFWPGTEAHDLVRRGVRDARGRVHRGDRVVLCPGAAHGGLLADALADVPLTRVRLQMLETAPLGEPVPTALADGDSLRYYPAFAGARGHLGAQDETAAAFAAQLLLVQRADGGLTIGDTHDEGLPLPFDLDERATGHLLSVAQDLLGRTLPPVVRRWAGVYSRFDPPVPGPVYYRAPVAEGVEVVTGPGGRGMTLAPAIAEETFA
jgi:FAD dependent oxidoreductase TIGR03364